jgi:pyrroloquinoline quinone (PQQ) biosynthesis protein C
MLQDINDYLYSPPNEKLEIKSVGILKEAKTLAVKAFAQNNEKAKLKLHRVLYQLYLAHLANPWEFPINNINHPIISKVKFILEKGWEEAHVKSIGHHLHHLPTVEEFPVWIKAYVQKDASNVTHPIFPFLRNEANLQQMREFFLQESPLEMLFGDIVAFMLPGTYGQAKIELVKNFWDELGHAKEERIHRNMRATLMEYLNIDANIYQNPDHFILEELELINLYLSLATNRSKHVELIGVMLTTEVMIPGRFPHQIAGWQRLGISDGLLAYFLEHTVVDEVHAEDWLDKVVMPILQTKPELMQQVAVGVYRRLNLAAAVLNKLYSHLRTQNDA